MEKISVIIPVYNVEKYLKRCLDSIVNQTYKNLEIILVDDGSKDNSGNICDEYSVKDHRIKVIHKKNSGLSDARNSGLNIANGEYIAFVDSDDIVEYNMYEEMLNEIKKYEADLVMCRLIDCYGKIPEKDGKNSIKVLNKKEAIKLVMEAKITSVTVVNKLYKKSIFNKIKFKNIAMAEDADIMINILLVCERIVLDMSQRYYYMHRESSITTHKFNPEIGYNPIKVYEEKYSLIQKEYPDLENVAKMRVIWANFTVLDRIINSGSKIDYNIVKYLRKNIKEVLKNNCFTLPRKVSCIALFINVNLYKLCLNVFNKKSNKLYK